MSFSISNELIAWVRFTRVIADDFSQPDHTSGDRKRHVQARSFVLSETHAVGTQLVKKSTKAFSVEDLHRWKNGEEFFVLG